MTTENQTDPNRKTIRQAQVELNRLGCELGRPNGIVGPKSRKEMRDFAAA
tara:strand:+ start:669 stop:818 length:150 start_codon:yes stop_codon:yes gene_type:complete